MGKPEDPAFQMVLGLNERLFADEDTKDLTIQLADGEMRAHRIVLQAASDAFKAMLTHDMCEKTKGVLALQDIDCASMRVFLRLLYTGHVDPTDWQDASPKSGTSKIDRMQILHSANVHITGQDFTSTADTSTGETDGWDSGVVFDCSSADDVDLSISMKGLSWTRHIALGLLPAPDAKELPEDAFESTGFGVVIPDFTVYGQDGTCDDFFSDSNHPSYLKSITMRFSNSTGSPQLQFAHNDQPFATFWPEIPSDTCYYPAVLFGDRDTCVTVTHEITRRSVPLDILIPVIGLAKKYMVETVLMPMLQAAKGRLQKAYDQDDTQVFVQVFAAAIKTDIGGLRWLALDLTKKSKDGFSSLRARYDAGDLPSEVRHELAGIWPMPASKAKRIRLV